MKTAIFAVALAIGGTAFAQTTDTTTTTTTAPGGQTVAPGNSAPERDARGIPVVSDPATAPAGANQAPPTGAQTVPAPNQQQVFSTQPAAQEYPACSRTVTDNCVQAYERGSRRPR